MCVEYMFYFFTYKKKVFRKYKFIRNQGNNEIDLREQQNNFMLIDLRYLRFKLNNLRKRKLFTLT